MKAKIIVDCMGGDNAPGEVVRGVLKARLKYNASYILVGDANRIYTVLAEEKALLNRIEIVDAPVTVEMTDDPLCILHAKKDSSMATALRMLAEGKGDAVVSTGNTGALYTGATLIVKKIKGIKRPAIASILPMQNPVLLLDSGANIACTPEYMTQFAVMGSIYMHSVLGIESPRVGLLNNGAERSKGTELQQKTYEALESCPGINFTGNTEANVMPFDCVDVLVADGFTGNILLKNVEGMGKLMLTTMKELLSDGALTKLSALPLAGKLRKVKKKFSAGEYGGAPLLGLSKPVIKAHGSSDAYAVMNAIRQAIEYSNSGAISSISKEIKQYTDAAAQEQAAVAESKANE